jgi:membrane protein
VPGTTLKPIDDALRAAFKSDGTALAALGLGLVTALYGGTGYLEAARRSLNVVFESRHGRSFLRRKLTDVASILVLFALVLATLVLMFAGGGVVRDLLGSGAAGVWKFARWPAAVLTAMLVFSFVYYVTPDVSQRSFRWITPGAAVGVALWVGASIAFSAYLKSFSSVNVTYGSFAAAIILLFWLWLTNVALLFGAELNAEIERVKQVAEGVPEEQTLDLPPAA